MGTAYRATSAMSLDKHSGARLRNAAREQGGPVHSSKSGLSFDNTKRIQNYSEKRASSSMIMRPENVNTGTELLVPCLRKSHPPSPLVESSI